MFPLEKGNRWIYNHTHNPPVLWTVTEKDADVATLAMRRASGWKRTIMLRERALEVDILTEGGAFGLFYRFEAGSSWEHRDWDGCDDRRPPYGGGHGGAGRRGHPGRDL
jgi:hypothetical protein